MISRTSTRRQVLTNNEGALLALIRREQPVTVYQVAKLYDRSPIHTFNTKKGKLYPLVGRLQQLGLVEVQGVPGDRRGTQRLSCTAEGEKALKQWVRTIHPTDTLLLDPLRKKVQAFNLLTQPERIEWIDQAQRMLEAKRDDVMAYAAEEEGEFGPIMKENALASLDARIRWLKRLRQHVEASSVGSGD